MTKKFIIMGLIAIFLSPIAHADEIKTLANKAWGNVAKINQLVQGDSLASGEIKTKTQNLQTTTKALQGAINTHGMHQKSTDELWKVIRQQRDLDVLLSVSPLRKNSEIMETLRQLESHLNAIRKSLA